MHAHATVPQRRHLSQTSTRLEQLYEELDLIKAELSEAMGSQDRAERRLREQRNELNHFRNNSKDTVRRLPACLLALIKVEPTKFLCFCRLHSSGGRCRV